MSILIIASYVNNIYNNCMSSYDKASCSFAFIDGIFFKNHFDFFMPKSGILFKKFEKDGNKMRSKIIILKYNLRGTSSVLVSSIYMHLKACIFLSMEQHVVHITWDIMNLIKYIPSDCGKGTPQSEVHGSQPVTKAFVCHRLLRQLQKLRASF